MKTDQEFYQNYLADDNLSELSERLLYEVRTISPKSVLDFGCGTGKHIKNLGDIVALGLDVSMWNLTHANVKNGISWLMLGYDLHLQFLTNFDVVFTCSVLDHIEHIDRIMIEFKRIATKAVYLAEPCDVVGPRYYAHSYGNYGFVKIPDFEWKGEDGATYHIWKWERNGLPWVTTSTEIPNYHTTNDDMA